MERRFVLFLVLTFTLLLGYSWLMQKLHPPKPAAQEVAAKEGEKAGGKAAEKEKPKAKPAVKQPAAKLAEKPQKPVPALKAQPQPLVPQQWIPLGSADSNDPHRMLVTVTNKGAAVARIELNSPFYCDIDHRNGYLGHLVMDSRVGGRGCRVQVVGPGTPAAEAGIMPGDVIQSLDGKPVDDQEMLDALLAKTKPRQTVSIVVMRGGKTLPPMQAKLRRIPLEVIKPEDDDPLSMLLTLQQFDGEKISDDEKAEKENWDAEDKDRKKGSDAEEAQLKDSRHLELIRRELGGVNLRTANWTVVPNHDKNVAKFRYVLPEKDLEITKTYRLAEVPKESQEDGNYKAYHLEFEIEIRNTAASESHKVAYRLDGPNGLPTEGAWYSSRVTRSGGSGIRDFIISMGGSTPEMVGAVKISGDKDLPVRPDTPPDKMLTFIGVDAQYFSAVLMPQRENPTAVLFEELMPIRVGKVNLKRPTLTNTSCRLVSAVNELKPGAALTHKFQFFAGPKKSAVVEPYGLGELIYFGWPIFSAVAVPLTYILHFFFAVVRNYGLAIILLTVFVRGCMFPLSLKQAAGAQKMQMLQPEIKKLQEKHKGNAEARTKAQQELFRKHNYNPLAGCLPIFIQMPIFIGLYRSLMVAIELRDAPLLSHSIRWCSNLAGPDMLFDWSSYMPPWFNEGIGLFALGPYFNLLPLLTIILFIVQQKMFMPPAADEQAAMQQKMMKYMMIFMGVMFFKVASGLCIYFIASSLWGLAERRFLPKTTPPAGAGNRGSGSPYGGSGEVESRADAKAREREAAKGK